MTSSDRAQSSRADNISSDAAESEDEEEHSKLVSLGNLPTLSPSTLRFLDWQLCAPAYSEL